MPTVEHPVAPATLVPRERADDEPEREMLEAFGCQSLRGRETGDPVAHADNERDTDEQTMLFREEADPADLPEIQTAGLLDQERSAAKDQSLSQCGHFGMSAEHQREVEILIHEVVVVRIKSAVQLIGEPPSGELSRVRHSDDPHVSVSQCRDVQRKMPVTYVEDRYPHVMSPDPSSGRNYQSM